MRHDAFVFVVDEVAARPVGAKADGVVGTAPLRLVLRVTGQVSQLVRSVRELTLVPVLAMAALLERSAQLRLVASRVHTTAVTVNPVLAVAEAAVQLAVCGVPPGAGTAVTVPGGTVLGPRNAGRGGSEGTVVQGGPGAGAGGPGQVAVARLGVRHRRRGGVGEILATVISGLLLHATSAAAVAVAAVLETEKMRCCYTRLLSDVLDRQYQKGTHKRYC